MKLRAGAIGNMRGLARVIIDCIDKLIKKSMNNVGIANVITCVIPWATRLKKEQFMSIVKKSKKMCFLT